MAGDGFINLTLAFRGGELLGSGCEKVHVDPPAVRGCDVRLRPELHDCHEQRIADRRAGKAAVERRCLPLQGSTGPKKFHSRGTRSGNCAIVNDHRTRNAVQSKAKIVADLRVLSDDVGREISPRICRADRLRDSPNRLFFAPARR